MRVYPYQRPHGLTAQVTVERDLPLSYEASVEVGVPGVGAYWDIIDDDGELVANGFAPSEREAYLAIYEVALTL